MFKKELLSLLLITAYLTSNFIFSINLWFSISGFYMVFATLLILSVIVYSKREIIKAQYIDFLTVFALVLFIFTIVSFAINAEDINGQLSKAMWLNRIAMFLAPLVSLLYFIKKIQSPLLEKINEHKYLVLLFISLIIQVTLLRIVKVPDIDVYQVLRFGPPRLLSLQNPYKTGATVEELKNTNFGYSHYAYGPTTIFLFLPFDILFGEPRYLLIIANFLCAFALYKISLKFWANKLVSELISLIYLFNPRLVFF